MLSLSLLHTSQNDQLEKFWENERKILPNSHHHRLMQNRCLTTSRTKPIQRKRKHASQREARNQNLNVDRAQIPKKQLEMYFWNRLEGAASKNELESTLEQMDQADGFRLKPAHLGLAIQTCTRLKLWGFGYEIWNKYAPNLPNKSIRHWSQLLSHAQKAGHWERALDILKNGLPSEGAEPDLICFSIVLQACTEAGELDAVIETFQSMKESKKIVLDQKAYSIILKAYAEAGELGSSLELLEKMEVDCPPNMYCYSAVISGCAKAGQWEASFEVLRTMKAKNVEPNVICYGATMDACNKAGEWERTLKLFDGLIAENKKIDAVLCNSAIRACAIGRRVDQAIGILRLMQNKLPSSVTVNIYNSVLHAHARTGQWRKALDVLKEMKESSTVDPDVYSYTALIGSCKVSDTADDTDETYSGPTKDQETYIERSSLAFELLNEMKTIGLQPNVVTYTNLIGVLSNEGHWPQALILLDEMHSDARLKPTVVTYGAVLSSLRRNWPRSLELLSLMEEVHNVSPNAFCFNAVLSSLENGRRWKEALVLLESMKERDIVADIQSYNAALGACFYSKRYPESSKLVHQLQIKELCPFLPMDLEGHLEWDLHGLRLATACTLLASAIVRLADRLTSNPGVEDDSAITIITGRGLNTKNKIQNQPILQTRIPIFLSQTLRFENINPLPFNPGAFSVSKQSIREWALCLDSDFPRVARQFPSFYHS